MKRALIPLVLAVLLPDAHTQLPNIAESAYRKDMPDVLVPAVADNRPAFSIAAFKTAYAKAGRPTIAVLWNREFTDMLRQSTSQSVSIDTAHAAAVTGERVRIGGHTATQATAVDVSNITVTAQDGKTVQARRASPVEHKDLRMRSAFTQALASAGARLVDRNVVMRTTAASRKGGSLDSQQIETDALTGHAALLMEVLNTPDASAPTGWATYVSIKSIRDGIVLMEGYLDGRLPEGSGVPKFKADPRGDFRRDVVPVSVEDVGRRIAEETLMRLGEALTR
jgi:hypothetical protein